MGAPQIDPTGRRYRCLCHQMHVVTGGRIIAIMELAALSCLLGEIIWQASRYDLWRTMLFSER